MTRVMVSCGEPSGDLYAGALTRELRRLSPEVRVSGFGGDRLAAGGATLIGNFHGLAVTGLVEVVKLLPRTWATYRQLVAAAEAEPPDVFVAIDFPDFNFRLANALKRRGIPVVYYVSPQLWAWRPGRLKTMRRFVDRMLVIFPFEARIYEDAGIPVEFVGHPLIDLLPPAVPRAEFLSRLGLDSSAPTVVLLPGSRANEVRLILPVQLEASATIAQAHPGVQFVIARGPGLASSLFDGIETLRQRGVRIAMVEGESDAALSAADAVVTASGTATVQTALHDKPMVVVYRLSPLTYRLGIRFVSVKTYAMVNLVAGRTVVPELMQDACTPAAIASHVLEYLSDPARVATTRAGLAEVRKKLGGPGASERAARAVLQVAARASGSHLLRP